MNRKEQQNCAKKLDQKVQSVYYDIHTRMPEIFAQSVPFSLRANNFNISKPNELSFSPGEDNVIRLNMRKSWQGSYNGF